LLSNILVLLLKHYSTMRVKRVCLDLYIRFTAQRFSVCALLTVKDLYKYFSTLCSYLCSIYC